MCLVIQNRTDYAPYLSPELKVNMQERDNLKETAAKTGDNEDYNKYKDKRNEVGMNLKTAEKEYFDKKFSDENNSSGNLWKTAYSALGSFRTSFPSQILHAGRLISNPQAMATEVNKFFVNKIAQLKTENPHDERLDSLVELKNFISKKEIPKEGFELREINEEEMDVLIKNLKGKKSLGLDWICGYSLKLAAYTLKEELQILINLSIKKKEFVTKWKYTKVLPGWKNKGTRFELKFYRPISNLSEVSKLVEKAVYCQMYEYLLINQLIHPNHHGFLQNCSTATALQQILDGWLQHLDNQKLVAGLFLDLSAGFDIINHRILLKKMKQYNFTDSTMEWFSSYLLDRYQCVQVESSFSPFLKVPWGVPQGSILGPLLFLFYINELPDIVYNDNTDNEDELVVYADDNTPFTADKDPVVLQSKIQVEANTVTDWFSRNDMIVSGDKTKLIVVGTKAARKNKLVDKDITLSCHVAGEATVETTSEKLLGVIVNNTATWHHHIHGDHEHQGLLKQLSSRVGMLKKLRRVMNPRKLKTIMEGLFTSKLIYCMTVWGRVWNIPGSMDEETRVSSSLTKDDLRRLQVLQNKCLRLISNSKYDTPTNILFQKTNLLSVHQLTAHLMLSQVYNIYQTKLPYYHYNRLFHHHLHPPSIGTRSLEVNDPSRVDFNLSLARTNFFYQASRLWAAIPDSIKGARNKNSFKQQSKTWVKTNIAIKP